MLNREILLESLQELSDRNWQEYYWRGMDKNVVCEPVELYESLLNGSGLSRHVKLKNFPNGIPNDYQKVLDIGNKFFELIDRNEYDVEAILSDTEMNEIRNEASNILRQL